MAEVIISYRGDVAILFMSGDLSVDTGMIALFDEKIQGIPGGFSIVVDMKQVTGITEAGLGALIDADTYFKFTKGRFALANVPECVEKTVGATRLKFIFDAIYPTAEMAVASLISVTVVETDPEGTQEC